MSDLKWINYWKQLGQTYESAFVRSPVFEAQERALIDALDNLEFDSGFDSVLEVGCGFGRITSLVLARHNVAYTAIDVSPDMLASVALRVPRAEIIESSVQDFDADGRTWDLVLAVEVLMHVPPDEIEAVVDKLRSLSSRYIVTLDYAGSGMGLAAHNWAHDYEALFADATRIPIGSQMISLVTL